MPGNVQSASTSLILPLSLSRSWERISEYPILYTEYADGRCERSSPTTNSIKRWRLSRNLSISQINTLLSFLSQTEGPLRPFYFYDGTDTSSPWGWDPTGVAVTGRYTVRFTSSSHEVEYLLGSRFNTSLEMEEVQ